MSAKEDFEGLLTHPGWLRLVAYAKQEWGPVAYARKLKAIIADNPTAESIVALKVLDKVNDEMNLLLSYPQEQLRLEAKRLEAAAEREQDFSRRGSL